MVQAFERFPRDPTIQVRSDPDTDPPELPNEFGMEPFGAGEMAVFVHLGDDPSNSHDAFEAMDHILERTLNGVAALQDSTVVDGFGQWVIGRPDE